MNEQSVVAQQLQRAQTKLDAAIKSRASLEEDFNAQTTLLTLFISKLSNVCKGIDLELDNRLAKLRVLLTKSAPFSDIESEISAISQILNHHASKNEKHIREMHDQFHIAGKTLQKVNGLPADVRRNLRELLNTSTDHKEALIQYIPKLNELIDLYGQAITNKLALSAEETVSNIAFSDQSPIENDSIKKQERITLANNHVLQEIIRILNDIQLSKKQLTKLNSLEKKLTAELDEDQLLDTLMAIFNIVIEDMRVERKIAKSFLSSLSKALSTVQQSVNETISSNSSYQAEQKKINESLSKQLSDLTEKVDRSPSLTEVKKDIQHHLLSIAETIKKKSQIEIDHFAQLNNQLSIMQSKIDALEQQSMTFEKRLAEQKQKSMRDALTKLNNRAAFDEYFAHCLVKHQNTAEHLAIVVLDLDDFKRINDTYGHTAGDKTLQVIANILKKVITPKTFVARYGGEEFVMIYTGRDKESLVNELNTLRKSIAKLPFRFRDTNVNISTSIGATHITPSDNIHTAFERADSGLYQAKEKGKNQVIYL